MRFNSGFKGLILQKKGTRRSDTASPHSRSSPLKYRICGFESRSRYEWMFQDVYAIYSIVCVCVCVCVCVYTLRDKPKTSENSAKEFLNIYSFRNHSELEKIQILISESYRRIILCCSPCHLRKQWKCKAASKTYSSVDSSYKHEVWRCIWKEWGTGPCCGLDVD